MADPVSIDVVLPCYNEISVLRSSVERTLQFFDTAPQYKWHIVIADNGSTDRTDELARTLAVENEQVSVIAIPQKGRGHALHQAWTTSSADIVTYMDVDLSTRIEHLLDLVKLIAHSNCEVAIGTRLSKQSKTKRSLKREITSRGYVFLIRLFFPSLSITDAQCGFKALKRTTAERIVPKIKNREWFFDTELLIVAHKEKSTICELPVEWTEDPDSKVNILKTVLEDVRGLIRMRF